MFQRILGLFGLAKKDNENARSGKWPALEKKIISEHPYCSVCGIEQIVAIKKGGRLIAHHIKSFHEYPELELDEKNLIVLCESRGLRDCHYLYGHFGINWTVNNPRVVEMANDMFTEIKKAKGTK